ncbi:hypothetical protein GCM10010289_32720 [Streptomyces violascens]|nr:hypothetical protein GCM10010289_32720 [Streptomyces violascens]
MYTRAGDQVQRTVKEQVECQVDGSAVIYMVIRMMSEYDKVPEMLSISGTYRPDRPSTYSRISGRGQASQPLPNGTYLAAH